MKSALLQDTVTRFATAGTSDTAGRLRVTYILGSLADAGTERQVLQLIQRLDRRRFDPSLILMESLGVERAQGLVDNCFVLGLPQAGSSRWLSRSASLIGATRRTAICLRSFRSDVLHAFLPAPSILGGIAARLAGVPVIIGSRRSLPSHYRSRKRAAAWADTLAFRLAHFNLGNSRAVTTEMLAIGKCPQPRCGTIYNGVDLERFRLGLPPTLRRQLGWTRDDIVFGMVANFRPCKRHRDFVDAAACIAGQHANARFLLTGADSGTKQDVLRQIAALSLTAKFRVLDSTPAPENVFAALDVYVCASEAEGFSNVLLEAMSCGKAVIATRVGGNQEAVTHGLTGLLVPANNPQTLAEAAARLLNDPALRHRFGKAGRERVQQAFSIAAMVRAHEDLYLRLSEAHHRSASVRSIPEEPQAGVSRS
jgi:glycosyltransferase involved in cell wall biosynthesis